VWHKLWLQRLKRPVHDVLLAKVQIAADGTIVKAHILESPDPEHMLWLDELVSRVKFVPARMDGIPTDDDALLFVRAITARQELRPGRNVVGDSLWIRNYSRAWTSGHLPEVHTLLLHPSEKFLDDNMKPDYGEFEFDGLGSDWSLEVLD
jgi:hypothetical protein